jgi:hypothetical protein
MNTWQIWVKRLGQERYKDAVPIQRPDAPKEGMELSVPVPGNMIRAVITVTLFSRPLKNRAREYHVRAEEILPRASPMA